MAPWEVFFLVSQHLDPKSLAVASCVSKSWLSSISCDHIWEPLCTAHFPSLANLKIINQSLPYYRLYAIASVAAKRRFQSPSTPRLALGDLIFIVNIFNLTNNNKSSGTFTLEKPGNELIQEDRCSNNSNKNRIFKFDIEVDECEVEAAESVRVSWNVVLKGWKGVFTMLECQGKRGVIDWWFWEELPLSGCCSSLVDSGVVADLRFGFSDKETSPSGGNVANGNNRKVINKVTLGMLSAAKLRYVSVDDALRYLLHFLD